ncbi:hypothetical protein Pmar_PMAR017093 [Perkinsus marinus ATCC 50983]|uniref:Uncharacterized protein n=1 Tax=Perkinsus marinus (strain ATCC 50983 / TXsc) TaxID=423536 RepID=C5LSJ4_PERM5|nr:hypothetical protein Pmar_PMAR017093 [Perkinsus marinus ATCC 50983]EER00235.1 hypothetical protein Pmar_PMAR017093 [Perkinsus marinus ATCC 50983]|eukprot:XP_002767517.1 hypothetical protein Pmar_PMAR017093 [Perkinsus marinus ATCC 50983]
MPACGLIITTRRAGCHHESPESTRERPRAPTFAETGLRPVGAHGLRPVALTVPPYAIERVEVLLIVSAARSYYQVDSINSSPCPNSFAGQDGTCSTVMPGMGELTESSERCAAADLESVLERPENQCCAGAIERFIRDKYVRLKYVPRILPVPPCDLVAEGRNADVYRRYAKHALSIVHTQRNPNPCEATAIAKPPARIPGPKPAGCSRRKKRLVQRFWDLCRTRNARVDLTEIDVLQNMSPSASCEVIKRWTLLIQNGNQRYPLYGLWLRQSQANSVIALARSLGHHEWLERHDRMCPSSKEEGIITEHAALDGLTWSEVKSLSMN